MMRKAVEKTLNPPNSYKACDEEAKWLYAALIGMSWANAGTQFEICQQAWELWREHQDIIEITNHGHGKVIRRG